MSALWPLIREAQLRGRMENEDRQFHDAVVP